VTVGAGVAGLVASLLLARRGFQVTLVEKESRVGGKLREVSCGGLPVDSGPTVFTMRWVFEAVLREVGERLDDHLGLSLAEILARHQWNDGAVLDLHAEPKRTADAIAAVFGRGDADGFLRFCARAAHTFAVLNEPYLEKAAPTPFSLALDGGIGGALGLARIGAYSKLWNVIGRYFRDPRLRQLFGRYATYCGSSPFDAPGPLTIVSHVEQRGVWLVEGGMHRIALMFEKLARELGVEVRTGTTVDSIVCRNGRAAGVRLAGGEFLPAEAVVFNGEPGALASGLLGEEARRATPGWTAEQRSLSALTWSCLAEARGFPLVRHTVFFSDDYAGEFQDIFSRRRLPVDPTIYVCAQDRQASAGAEPPEGPERLFLLVNAPAAADLNPLSPEEIDRCQATVRARLSRAGLTISAPPGRMVTTAPQDFAMRFPGSGGALYGRAAHGWRASFQRPLSRTAVPGLFLAGGTTHPGPGVPMAALSGCHAAAAVTAHLGSRTPFRLAAMPGGISTPPARTAPRP